jgi:protein involved in polysaccharide export with SLBB domain
LRPLHVSRFTFHAVIGAALAAGVPASAQQAPPPSQAQAALQQAVQQQPGLADMLRGRIRESGLTSDQVRARLQAAGYPATLLDAYLGAAQPGQATAAPGAQELAAITALGLPAIAVRLDSLPVDTGLIRGPGSFGPATPSGVFGVDVFRRTSTQFLPLLSGPVPSDYKLGPGDALVLILTGDVELAYTLQITREGFILIPQVGQLFVSNLTLDQLRSVLFARLGRVYSGVRRTNATTHFDVSVASVRAVQVYVVGEVGQPGAYQISSLGTVLTSLYAAGGITERANTRGIVVQRSGRPAATFDLYDYLLKGDTRNDIRLETGDVVFVGIRGPRIAVRGAVVRPAIYELKAGETLSDLLRAAGGFRADAAFERLKVNRILPAADRGTQATARVAIDVPLSTVSGSRLPAPGSLNGVLIPTFTLEDGDIVDVDALAEQSDEYDVSIVGMVQQPGRYPWRPGITLRELMVLARGPTLGADLREAEVARMPTDRSQGQMANTVRVPLDSSYLGSRDSAGRYWGPPGLAFPRAGSSPDVPLQPFDNVLILRQPDFELQRTVTINGEVSYPGTYALISKQERLSTLIARAGGLSAHAYPEGVRFVRPLGGAGRINLNLRRAMEDTTSRDNIILQPGDEVTIPEYEPSVRVFGAVNSPGSVLWRRGAGLDYYISAAGGFGPLAVKGRVSVRYANGEVRTKSKFLFVSSSPTPGPGSEVFVPARDPTDKTDWVSIAGSFAQILASTVAIIVVVTR